MVFESIIPDVDNPDHSIDISDNIKKKSVLKYSTPNPLLSRNSVTKGGRERFRFDELEDEHKAICRDTRGSVKKLKQQLPASDEEKREYRQVALIRLSAFEYYFNLGPGRSIRDVANYFDLSEKVVYAWSSKYRWMEEVNKRQKALDEDLRLHKQDKINKVKKAVLDFLAHKMQGLVEEVEGQVVLKNDIDLKNMKDLETAVGIYRDLLGDNKKGGGDDAGNVSVNLVIKGR